MTTSNRILIETFNGLLHAARLDPGQPIECAACSNVLDSFAELVVRGVEAPDLMPLVQAHLNNCQSCRAGFEALVADLDHGPRQSVA